MGFEYKEPDESVRGSAERGLSAHLSSFIVRFGAIEFTRDHGGDIVRICKAEAETVKISPASGCFDMREPAKTVIPMTSLRSPAIVRGVSEWKATGNGIERAK